MRTILSLVIRAHLGSSASYITLLLFLTVTGFVADGVWRQALPGYKFQFPRDHASHPEFKIEWWYYTGNLADGEGHRFGYQLTFFRIGVDPRPSNPSRWALRDLFMAHFAMTDISGKRYRFAERINRAGVGWAGALTDQYRVWNQDWEACLDASGEHLLRAAETEMSLELRLNSEKLPVIHGENGISQKGQQTGNASHYYSLTRMPTRGTLMVAGQCFKVEGLSWMDHEFGTSFLEPEQVGWDWFSLQLEDGTDLMIFQLRHANGSRDPHSSGTLIDSSGKRSFMGYETFVLDSGGKWRSTASGASYPIEWGVKIPGRNLDLAIRTAVADQELRTSQSTGVNYWEGAIEAVGTRNGQPVRGRGYLEMTGYGGEPISSRFR